MVTLLCDKDTLEPQKLVKLITSSVKLTTYVNLKCLGIFFLTLLFKAVMTDSTSGTSTGPITCWHDLARINMGQEILSHC